VERLYFYKLTTDNGGAPCIRGGLLSLAICKPMIRSTAKEGDMIFGFAAKSLRADNRLLYIARVTAKARCGLYFTQPQFSGREDRIYKRRGDRFVRRSGARHHFKPHDLAHDLGQFPSYTRANVLLSTDFRYFGARGSDDYKRQFPRIRREIEKLKRGFRVQLGELLRAELLALKEQVWANTQRKMVGKPTSKPSRSSCHRSKSCGVC
jgi:hypothetical protein